MKSPCESVQPWPGGSSVPAELVPPRPALQICSMPHVSGPPMIVQPNAAAPVGLLLGEWGKVGLVLLLFGVAALGLRRITVARL